MTNISISKDVFELHCPFGVDTESEIFESLTQYFSLAFMDIVDGLLGRQLGETIVDLIEGDEEGVLSAQTNYIRPLKISEIKEQIEEYVCKRAMYMAIPSLDLVLTNNGFAVVQARDLVPAIPERVTRLRNQCENDYDNAYDKLIKGLPGNSLTKDLLLEGKVWKNKTSHLVWTAEDFDRWCDKKDVSYNRHELNMASARLYIIENLMRDAISEEQFDEFISMLRGNAYNENQAKALGMLLKWLSVAWSKPDNRVVREDGTLLCFMEDHPDDFEKYVNSDQYTARHEESIETTKKDGCFIFR